MKIIYEPHPVSPERKAELRAQGYKIMDAVFAPRISVNAVQAEDETETPTEAEAPLRTRGRPRKAN